MRPALVSALASFASGPSSAHADGYFSGTTGARAAGRGGAFTARADDLSAVVHNPAGLAHLTGDGMFQLGNRFSYNAYAFERRPTLDWGNPEAGVPPYVAFAEVTNDAPLQLLEPFLGVASKLGLPDFTFALTLHAPAGVSRQQFPVDGGQRYMMVERESLLLVSAASAAWQPVAELGVGASLQLTHAPRLRYQLVIDANPFPGEAHPVSSELDMLATMTGSDWLTADLVLGAWWRPEPFLELAIAGHVIPGEIDTGGTLAVEPLSAEIEEDVELRRDGVAADDVRLRLPLPVGARAGVRYRGLQGSRELFDVELDVGYEAWSRVERFHLDTDGLAAHLLGRRVDIGSIVIPKRWRDMIGVRLGGDYAVLPERLTVRGGVFYESAVAPRSHAHVDFAAGTQLGGALGASLFVLGVELALAYQYRHQPAMRVPEGEARVFQQNPGTQCAAPYTDPDLCHPQYQGLPAPPVNAGEYRAHAHAASLELLHRF
jgi:long-subunit fatty acid transport protein